MRINVSDAINKAKEHIEKGENLQEAESILNQVLNGAIHHKEIKKFEILFMLGSVYTKKEYVGAAMVFYKEALKEYPDFIEARNNLGCLYKKEGLKDLAEIEFKEVIKLVDKMKDDLKPEDKSDFITNLASLKILNGTPKEAIDMLDKAVELNPSGAERALWNRSLAYLELGDYERGFRDYDIGDRNDRHKDRKYNSDITPIWDGAPDKVVAVFGEQGIGDELMFASMLPDMLKDCKQVILDAHLRLVEIFRNSFPNLIVYGTREEETVPWHKYHKIDAKIPIGSLGKFYRKKEQDFPGTPYLNADPALVQKYKVKLENMGNKPKIGFSWRGGVKTTNSSERYIPLELWKEIFDLDCDFISLQYNPNSINEIKPIEEKYKICLNHWPDILEDYDETAGLVSNLDLIISVPQSVVHLAGGLGISAWQLSPKKAMWQVGPYGKDAPWYSCVKNIWQEESDNWQPVMKKAKEKLCSLLQTNTVA